MKVLFVHQNFPGQFPHLAPELARRGHDCLALTDATNQRPSPIPVVRYRHQAAAVDAAATRLGRNFTTMTDRGVTVARAAARLRDDRGYAPDLILAHSGWGESLFLKEIWPRARLIVYAEFYYRGIGRDIGFDPEFGAPTLDATMIAQARAAHLAQALIHSDGGLSPTHWQADSHPPALRRMIRVIFDGIDTDALAPDPAAQVTLPDGRVLRPGDPVVTFVNRNLEPYRGWHVFARTLPAVLAGNPAAQVVIVGGDGVSYGQPPKSGGSWKDALLAELGPRLDPTRVHFLGRVPWATFAALMRVSAAHVYLTYPFVLSWSMIEAMAAGALVLGSNTPPVAEVIEDGVNGRLIDFFDTTAWAAAILDALANPARHLPLRQAARATAVDRYDLRRVCLPQQLAFLGG
ncbi:MAG: glycosyltransferase [Rhodobacterales bacterium]|nr:glycosyltransferase [Rhodobacterales bacterium]